MLYTTSLRMPRLVRVMQGTVFSMTINSTLRNVSKLLARIPSIGYMLLYLLAIPLFAGIYTSLAGEFYHTTAQYEPYLQSDEHSILEELRNSMISNYVEVNGSPIPPKAVASLNWDSVQLHDLRAQGREFSFTFVDHRDAPQRIAHPGALRFHFLLFWGRRTTAQGQEFNIYRLSPEPGYEFFGKVMPRLFPLNPKYLGPYEIVPENEGFIKVTPQLERMLIAWAQGVRGFPSESSGVFMRMLYFSAITITTVGFGDILPTSDRTRLAVAIEAILGVVLVGLFLNALGSEIAASPKGGP